MKDWEWDSLSGEAQESQNKLRERLARQNEALTRAYRVLSQPEVYSKFMVGDLRITIRDLLEEDAYATSGLPIDTPPEHP